MSLFRRSLCASVAALALSTASALAVELEFYFPVAIGGDAANLVQSLADDYMAQHPDVKVSPVFAGTYPETITKTLTAVKGGNPPPLSMVGAVNVFLLLDEEVIEPFEAVMSEAEAKAWFDGFLPAYVNDTTIDGKHYGVPFQRSTPVLYWNKDAFKAAGLDPEVPPATWTEMLEMARKLTLKDAAGNVTQWGVRIPSTIWLYQAMANEAGDLLASADGKITYFDSPGAIKALEFLVQLAKDGVMTPGIADWGATPKSFFESNSAIIWTTTGNLTNIRKNAPFPFGLAMLPADVRRGAVTGGGSFFLFKDASPEEKTAAVEFLKWLTAPEQAARWSIGTGYVAPSYAAWETQTMKDYVAEVPVAVVAREQLQYAVPELSTYENSKISQILTNALEAAVSGKTAPAEALKAAQAEADAILAAYR
jgi:sn-glycerol 3-phosphate transport system substrate-binding protein